MATEIVKSIMEFLKIVIPMTITAYLGYLYAVKKDKEERKRKYEEMQLTEFYSPILALRRKILSYGEMREEVYSAMDKTWRSKCKMTNIENIEYEKEFKDYDKGIVYQNDKFRNIVFPLYNDMIEVFSKKYWLAEQETSLYYNKLIKFHEMWSIYFQKAVPGEAMSEIGITESELLPFYENVEKVFNELRLRISKKDRNGA
ncbi:MAG: hypothetical protein AB7T10_04670 [bacterium]